MAGDLRVSRLFPAVLQQRRGYVAQSADVNRSGSRGCTCGPGPGPEASPNRRTLFGQLASPFGRGVTGAELMIHLFSRTPRTSSVLEWLGSGVADCPGKKLRGPLGGWGPLSGGFVFGGVLLSHTLAGAVPSALEGLASGFGMGPGVSPPLWPP